ncbi:hypothetical protein ACX0G9_11645 [Flavitalea flava]
MPYTKILAIYLDEACYFNMLDSNTYNICVKTCFLKEDNLEGRVFVENTISKNLTTSGTIIVTSSALFDIHRNSYDEFRKQIDLLSIDAILVVNVRGFLHEEVRDDKNKWNSYKSIKNLFSGDGDESNQTLNAAFQCYLLNSKTSSLPIWVAQLETKGKYYHNGKKELNQSMVGKMAETLKSAGYIAH